MKIIVLFSEKNYYNYPSVDFFSSAHLQMFIVWAMGEGREEEGAY